MSEPAGLIVDNILTAARRKTSQTDVDHVWRRLNVHYFRMCKEHSWHGLREMVSLDMTAATDETGLYMPANTFGIDKVFDQDNGVEFVHKDRSAADGFEEEGFRYYTYRPESTDQFFGRDVTVSNGGTTFTSASLTTDYTGQYVRFGSEPGYYKLSAIKTFAPAYYGNDIGPDGDVRIRPKEAEKLVILDRAENILYDRTIDIHYWRAPDPLYLESDMCVLPISTPLEMLVLIDIVGTIGKRQIAADRYRGEYTKSIAHAKELNPDFPREHRARDIHNRLFDMDERIFGGRRTNTSCCDVKTILGNR